MRILEGNIKDECIIGISGLICHQSHHPQLLYYSFFVITTGGPVEFRSATITDFQFASAKDQQQLQDFQHEYANVRTRIISLLGEHEEEFEYHEKRVSHHFAILAELNKLLEDELRLSRIKNRDDLLHLVRDMRPHIIELKNLAEI
jgi:hypothetical protein